MNERLRMYRPEPNSKGMQWVCDAPTDEKAIFRNAAMAHNMMSLSQVGRAVFVVIEEEGTERLAIRPPLSDGELRILSQLPYFQDILREIING